MLKYVETLRFIIEPSSIGRDDVGLIVLGSRLVKVPISSIMVPDDGFETEYTLGNSSDSVVDVSEWRSPESGDTTAVEVRDDLHGPS